MKNLKRTREKSEQKELTNDRQGVVRVKAPAGGQALGGQALGGSKDGRFQYSHDHTNKLHGLGEIPLTAAELKKSMDGVKSVKYIDWNKHSFTPTIELWHKKLKENGLDKESHYNRLFSIRKGEIDSLQDFLLEKNEVIYDKVINQGYVKYDRNTRKMNNVLSLQETKAFTTIGEDYEKYAAHLRKKIDTEIESERVSKINKAGLTFQSFLDKEGRFTNSSGSSILAAMKPTAKNWSVLNNKKVDLRDDEYSENTFVISDSSEHSLILGASGSGKSVSQLIPVLINQANTRKRIYLNYNGDNLFLTNDFKLELEQWLTQTNDGTYDFLKSFRDKGDNAFISFFLRFKLKGSWIKEIEGDQEWYERFPILFDVKDGKMSEPFVYAPSESVVIHDPKSELKTKTAGIFAAAGHKMLVLDFSKPFESTKFNLFSIFMKPFQELIEVDLERRDYIEQNKSSFDDLSSDNENKRQAARSLLGDKIEQLDIKIASKWNEFQTLFELVTGLMTGYTENNAPGGQKSEWVDFAHDAIQGAIFYGLMKYVAPLITQDYYQTSLLESIYSFEDENQVNLLDQFSIHSVKTFWQRVLQPNDSDSFSSEQRQMMLEIFGADYIDGLAKPRPGEAPVFSPANDKEREQPTFNEIWSFIGSDGSYLSKLVSYLSNADKTKKSINTSIATAFNRFDLIKPMSASTDVSLDSIFTHKATAIYLVVPWSRQETATFPTTIVSAIISQLEGKASRFRGEQLPVRANLILEEFPNMAAIPLFDKIISLARSYNLRLTMASQSYDQLELVYSKLMVSIIKQNSAIQTYIKSYDTDTNDQFSDMIGSITVKTAQEKETRGKDSLGEDRIEKTVDYAFIERKLIKSEELSKIPQFENISLYSQQGNRTTYFNGVKSFELENLGLLEDLTEFYFPKQTTFKKQFNPSFERFNHISKDNDVRLEQEDQTYTFKDKKLMA